MKFTNKNVLTNTKITYTEDENKNNNKNINIDIVETEKKCDPDWKIALKVLGIIITFIVVLLIALYLVYYVGYKKISDYINNLKSKIGLSKKL